MGAEVEAVIYSIKKRQTTYWDLSQGGTVTRIHFDGKGEFRFVEATVSSFTVVQSHPVLMDYQFAWESIFLASACTKPQEVLELLTEQVGDTLQNWHDASRYFNSLETTLTLLQEGHGLLMSAPLPISSKVRQVLTEAGLRFTHLPSKGPRWPREALIADENYVVAHSFRIEQLAPTPQ